MKAIYFTQTGAPADVLTLGDFPKPVPGPGEVLVRVLRRTINPSDTIFIKGGYRFQPEFPQIAGFEAAGVVEEGALPNGTLVSFFYKNTWAEYVVVPVTALYTLPVDFPIEKAAQFALNPFTAWGLLERAAVPAGSWLGLSAGNSAVSHITAQLAALRGIRTVSLTRHDTDGAAARIMDLTGGAGLAAVLDSVGGPIGSALLGCLAPRGRFIVYGSASPEPLQVPNTAIVYKFVEISGFGVRAYMDGKTPSERQTIAGELIQIIGADSFSMPVAATFPLEGFRDALQNKGKTQLA
ncbi:MAG TPA: zinc-dependent alcohol dehydrogenase family protein [Dinghuibacter sp.]|uniref:zinc-dependent alcohol dehydrogenase family protein n=1 Tax=Dinghuibacter sp. TaxID=2024697 RepID=UPI002C181163|nr:zinc-dependent alcohol dehydrogenase family protein [Dinghuibacter sp.]HTJ11925.1 zinc-dependent alcohol dehydrogenase family protein [Dinghuibacter sp.]